MPKSEKEALKALKRRVLGLKRKQKALLQEQSQLTYQQALLVSVVRSFTVAQVSKASQVVLADSCRSNNVNNYEQLLEVHTQLLKQLALSPPAADAQEEALFKLVPPLQPDPDVVRIAPRPDPLAYFTHLATQPALDVTHWTCSKELAAVSRDAVLCASLHLQLQRARPQQEVQADCNNGSGSAGRFHQLWDRYHGLMLAIILQGRPELIAEFDMYNLATMTLSPDNVRAATARRAAIPPLLGLTQQQLQDISAGAALFGRLMDSVLQQQQEELQQAQGTTSSPSSGHSLTSMHQDWEARQHSTGRMQVLLHKEYVIKAAAGAFMAGCFTWEQYSYAAVLSWPYPLLLPALVQELAVYHQQQQGK